MPPSLALLLWLVLLLVLLWRDPAREPRTSSVIWAPVAWMVIAGSRLPSQWFGAGVAQSAEAMQEGNSFDRLIYSAIIVIMAWILVSRSFNWGLFLRRNSAFALFLAFALLSVFWSDFPFVAMKRWFRDLGNYLSILVLLTDPQPIEAVRTALRRLSYLLIPLSLVMIKYFPQDAIHYEYWSGLPEFVGVATSKNTLGALCLITGIGLFWDTVIRLHGRKTRRIAKILILNGIFLAMIFRLLSLSGSATSRVCLILGCVVILLTTGRWGRLHHTFVKVFMPASFLVYLILTLGFSMNDAFAGMLGRNGTLTGRTEIWNVLLSIHTNPILGTGYESFWLGPRLQRVWELSGGINEAHNGYLEIYLMLGILGLVLLLVLLGSAYLTICRRLDRGDELAPLGAAMWTLLLFYCVTEAAFLSGLPWMTLLMGTFIIPKPIKARLLAYSEENAFVPSFDNHWSTEN